ncbi:MAG: lysophospholipid acyltransferase family protein [Bdellovibrionales bacterium]|nr:lysophospholipid acyltransferase family protein [Bdellovibrionales bacterium]
MGRLIGWIARAFLSLAAATFVWCPWWVRRASGVGLGAILRAAGLKASVVRENLRRLLPEDDAASERSRRRIFRQSYSHLGHLVIEVLTVLGPMRRLIARSVEVTGAEKVHAALAEGKGAILLSSHVGNWEYMAGASGKMKVPLMIVTKRLKPAWLHEAIERGRERCGVRGTYEPRTFRDVLSWLKEGRAVGFVLDQYAGPPIGVRVPFLGVPVGTATTVATVARRTGAPVFPIVCYRVPGGGTKVEVGDALGWEDCGDEVQRALAVNTARYVAILESYVRAHPEQWLWIHRRFKGDLSPVRAGEWEQGRVRR